MAVDNVQSRNSRNLQTLVAEMLQKGSNGKTIAYQQARQLVLLGSGHSQADEDRITNAVGDWIFAGDISVQMYPDANKFKMKLIPKTRVSGMNELETAVRNAVQGMAIPSRLWQVEFDWPSS